MDEPGAERRGRGREDEGAAAVDEEVAGYRGGAEQGALGAERLAAGVKGDQIVAAGEAVREAGAAGAEHAGGVRLIDHEDCVVTIGDRGEIGERGAVAVHAVKAFDRDPRRSGAAAGAPARDDVVERLRVIRSEEPTSELQSLMRI